MLLLRNWMHVFICSPLLSLSLSHTLRVPTCATLRHCDYNCCFIAFYFAAFQIDSGSNVNLMNYAPIILPLCDGDDDDLAIT